MDETRSASPEVTGKKLRRSSSAVLSEALFSHLLVTERKRSERSNRPFVLLSLTAGGLLLLPPKGQSAPEFSDIGRAALDALTAATRETDIVGWIRWPTVIGVIFSEIGSTEPVRAVEALRARVHRELTRRVDARGLRDFALDFRVYPQPQGADPQGPSCAADPLLHPDLYGDRPRGWLSAFLKRALDIVASASLLLLLTPLLSLVAAVVRFTSPGPVLFKQVRLGQLGKPFRMLKFRTMYVNVTENPHQEFIQRYIKGSGRNRSSGTQFFKLTNDRRITPVGRVLRKTSIDELPQLWNVLIGEMSLVGPRPPLPYEVAHYAPWHRRRVLEAKPGITGLWQVTGRSRTTFDEMVRLDLRYAKTRSFWTDVRILLRTPKAVVGGKGAC